MDAIESAETILRCINFINQSYTEHCEKQSELDKQLCDIAHMIEFTNIDIQRGYKLAKQMQDVYKERRIVKDEQEMLRILHDYLKTGTASSFTTMLVSHIGGAKKRKKHMEERIYTPRSKVFQEVKEEANDTKMQGLR